MEIAIFVVPLDLVKYLFSLKYLIQNDNKHVIKHTIEKTKTIIDVF